ncbi:MAG: amylo-alpha-1,6-glucosidase [Rhodothermales bacterium]
MPSLSRDPGPVDHPFRTRRLLCYAVAPVHSTVVVILLLGLMSSGCAEAPSKSPRVIDGLGIVVDSLQNREFSYTDKASGYYYGRTHRRDSSDWFAGWNVGRRRIFSDYRIGVGDAWQDRSEAEVTVYPHRLVRSFPQVVETFRLFDGVPVLSIALDSVEAGTIALALEGEMIAFDGSCGSALCYTSKEAPDEVIGVTTFRPEHLAAGGPPDSIRITDWSRSGGFLIALAPTADSLDSLLGRARAGQRDWTAARESRMERLVGESSFFASDVDSLTTAIRWIQLTLDELIMHQTGYGIYAGLPWFNDYWGRDLFISLPGATLVSGEFEVAASILRSFARYQNTDARSPNYGRVPNRLRPDDVIYNTTDGTPRFVIALFEYLKYSGDTDILEDLYPAVERSVDGPLRFWTDSRGYLTHDDADTWMDAKLDGRIPWSPRGNRAVDIEALWYRQLICASKIARIVGRDTTARRWNAVADSLVRHFQADFLAPHGDPMLADRLTAHGSPDFTMRPNQLFALDLVQSDSVRMEITRHVWESLVYPWGVASLSQADPNFHPYHEYWEYYPKDAAYHNGTVWLWNNGIAMQRMLEAHQTEAAYHLLAGMSHQALVTGAVGSLSENMDALPRPGSTYARRSGTFLQAWSNAEYLRVWYQYFLGVRPDALTNTLYLAPQIPEGLHEVDFRSRVFSGWMKAKFRSGERASTFSYEFTAFAPRVVFQLPPFRELQLDVHDGDRLEIVQQQDHLKWSLRRLAGSLGGEGTSPVDPRQVRLSDLETRIFDGVTFAAPELRPGLRALRNKRGD